MRSTSGVSFLGALPWEHLLSETLGVVPVCRLHLRFVVGPSPGGDGFWPPLASPCSRVACLTLGSDCRSGGLLLVLRRRDPSGGGCYSPNAGRLSALALAWRVVAYRTFLRYRWWCCQLLAPRPALPSTSGNDQCGRGRALLAGSARACGAVAPPAEPNSLESTLVPLHLWRRYERDACCATICCLCVLWWWLDGGGGDDGW